VGGDRCGDCGHFGWRSVRCGARHRVFGRTGFLFPDHPDPRVGHSRHQQVHQRHPATHGGRIGQRRWRSGQPHGGPHRCHRGGRQPHRHRRPQERQLRIRHRVPLHLDRRPGTQCVIFELRERCRHRQRAQRHHLIERFDLFVRVRHRGPDRRHRRLLRRP